MRTLIYKIAILTLITFLSGSFLVPQNGVNAAELSSIERLAGQTKIETALEIALKLNPGITPAVVLASPTSYFDALAGIPLAQQKEAPLLWVGQTPQENDDVLEFIKDHCDEKGLIYILGGEGVIPQSFETALQELGYKQEQIVRLGGSNRYETAIKIAQRLEYKENPIIITSGKDYSQVSGVAAIAAAQDSPVLFLPSEGNIPQSVIDYLNKIGIEGEVSLQIIGDPTVISESMLAKLSSKVTGLDPVRIERLSGGDRYDLMAKVNEQAFLKALPVSDDKTPIPQIVLTIGKDYADGIPGAVLAAKIGAPLIFINETLPQSGVSLLKDIQHWNKQMSSSFFQVTVLGGLIALPPQVVAEADSLFTVGQPLGGNAQVWTYAELYHSSVPSYGVQGEGNSLIVSESSHFHTLQAIHEDKTISLRTGQSSAVDEYGMPIGGYQDGLATEAMFNAPKGIARDEKGILYVADSGNGAIRTLDQKGNVKTLVKGLKHPTGIVLNSTGDIYVTETLNHRILRIDTQGQWTVFAGGGYTLREGESVGAFADGKGEQAQFNEPQGLAIDDEGNLYVADSGNQRIRRVSPEGIVTTLAGSGMEQIENTSYILGGYKDGEGKNAQFNFPLGLAVGKDKTIYVADSFNHCLRRITPEGVVSTLAGAPESGKKDGLAALAQFNTPSDVLLGKDGSLIIVDQGNALLRVYYPPNDESLDD